MFSASRILEAMDLAVDPCDDFFTYACGEWNRNYIIPDDMPSYNTFAKLREDLQAMLKGQLMFATIILDYCDCKMENYHCNMFVLIICSTS